MTLLAPFQCPAGRHFCFTRGGRGIASDRGSGLAPRGMVAAYAGFHVDGMVPKATIPGGTSWDVLVVSTLVRTVCPWDLWGAGGGVPPEGPDGRRSHWALSCRDGSAVAVAMRALSSWPSSGCNGWSPSVLVAEGGRCERGTLAGMDAGETCHGGQAEEGGTL
jgi:hypothetical protein